MYLVNLAKRIQEENMDFPFGTNIDQLIYSPMFNKESKRERNQITPKRHEELSFTSFSGNVPFLVKFTNSILQTPIYNFYKTSEKCLIRI